MRMRQGSLGFSANSSPERIDPLEQARVNSVLRKGLSPPRPHCISLDSQQKAGQCWKLWPAVSAISGRCPAPGALQRCPPKLPSSWLRLGGPGRRQHDSPSVLGSCGCCNKVPQTGGFRQRKSTPSQFRRADVRVKAGARLCSTRSSGREPVVPLSQLLEAAGVP